MLYTWLKYWYFSPFVKGLLVAVPILHLWLLSNLYVVTSGTLYFGPGVFFGADIISPVSAKRVAFVKLYMGLDTSSAKISLPNEVYDFFLICSSCSLSKGKINNMIMKKY